MKRPFVAGGLLLLLLGAFLYAVPGAIGLAMGNPSMQVTVSQRSYLVPVGEGNMSYVKVDLKPGYVLSASYTSSPGAVNFFLMDQGNFSLWSSGNGQASQVYPQSALGKSNYSFTFSGVASDQSYYIVFTSRASPGVVQDVLLKVAVSAPSGAYDALSQLPLALLAIGALVLAYGAAPRRKRARAEAPAASAAAPSISGEAGGAPAAASCPYCGAAVGPDDIACPQCGRFFR